MARTQRHSGIAIGPILFVIAILAVLATALSAGSGSFSGNTDTEKARTYAATILSYSSSIFNAVQRVKALGCSDTQISFQNSVVTGYTNSNAPPDKHCHVFEIEGGGMVWASPPLEALDSSYSGTASGFGSYLYSAGNNICGIGNTYWSGCGGASTCATPGPCGELIFFSPLVTLQVCQQIMALLNKSSTITQISNDLQMAKFQGDYDNSGNTGKLISGTNLTRQMAGCFQGKDAIYGIGVNPGTGSYHFYRVLVPR